MSYSTMAVTWIWVPMLDSDSLAAADEMEREIGGRHYWDGERRTAAAFASALGGVGELAWDAYLYYEPGDTWRDPAPRPADWAHQLGAGGWADPLKFAWGSDLTERLLMFARV